MHVWPGLLPAVLYDLDYTLVCSILRGADEWAEAQKG